MVTVRSKFPTLERTPGGPDNWVEAAGGLPEYIDRIARHLHYEGGMTISHAIATAVNTVKRWARGGGVVKYGDPNNKHVTAVTAAQAAAAVAEWEAKKAASHAGVGRGSASGPPRARLRIKSMSLSEVDVSLEALATRANAISDPATKSAARLAVLDLAMTKDGRKSFKRQGKWGHGFVPLDAKAKESKAKGSSVAGARIKALFGKATGGLQSKPEDKHVSGKPMGGDMKNRRAPGSFLTGKRVKDPKVSAPVKVRSQAGGTETAATAGLTQQADIRDSAPNQAISVAGSDKGGFQGTKRSTQPWQDIPQNEKVMRNGKRYVMAYFKGKNLLTEWRGSEQEPSAPDARVRVRASILPSAAASMGTAELRAALKAPGQSAMAKRTLNAALRKKVPQ